MSLTITKNYYFIAHLTQADLSMFNYFSVLKEELSIVNGSFVTLGKAIDYNSIKVHRKDTMLLAQSRSKSLASIGMLYGEGFNKISISREALENMQTFLLSDKAKFVVDALREVLISLVKPPDWKFST